MAPATVILTLKHYTPEIENIRSDVRQAIQPETNFAGQQPTRVSLSTISRRVNLLFPVILCSRLLSFSSHSFSPPFQSLNLFLEIFNKLHRPYMIFVQHFK